LAINRAGEKLTSNYNDQGAIALSLAQQETARMKQALTEATNKNNKLLGDGSKPDSSKTTGADGPIPKVNDSTNSGGGIITPETNKMKPANSKSVSRKYRPQHIVPSVHNFRINIINANQSRITSKRYISGY